MKEILAVAGRELKNVVLKRKYFMLFVLWPFAYGIMLASIYAHGVVTKLPCAVLDSDNTKLSRTLTRYVNSTRSVDIRYCAGSEDELKELFYSKNIFGALYIPRNFQSDIKKGSAAGVTLFVNGTNLLVANLIQADVKSAAGTLSAGIKIKFIEKAGSPPEKASAIQSQIRMDVTRLFNPYFNYFLFLIPGMWFAILHQIFMLFGALSIAQEKDRGTLKELFEISGHNALKIMAGKYIVYGGISVFLCFSYYFIFYPAFSVIIKGSLVVLLFYTMLFIFAVISLGFMISCALKDRNDAIKGTLLLAAPAFILSGYTWPIAYMPMFIKPVVYIIPLTEFLSGFKKIVFYGAGANQIGVEAGILLVMILVYSFVGVLFLKKAGRYEGF